MHGTLRLRIVRIILTTLLLASVPQFVTAQTVVTSRVGAQPSGKKPKPKPTPTPSPVPLGGDPNYTRSTGNTAGTADQWSAGTNWDATPTSGITTQLVFGGAGPTSLAAGATIFTNNDIAGDFKLNILDFTYAGPASGVQPTVTVSGNRLEFISNGATTPTMNLNATGTVKPLLTISNALLLTNNLTVTATSDGTLSGVISGGGSLTKSGAATLSLSGNNTFTGGLIIKGGTLSATLGNNNALGGSGSGAVTLGDSSGSASATLLGAGNNYGNPITVASGSSGTLTIGNSASTSAQFSGLVTLNNNLTLTTSGSGQVRLTGGVTGTGNIVLNHTGTGNKTFLDTTLVNNTGTITNSGSGTGIATIQSTLGANVTQLIQNSSTSVLSLDVTNNTAFVGSVAVNAGTLQLGSPTALNSSNMVSVASGATFDINNQDQTIAGLGTGTGTVTNSSSNLRTLTLGGSGAYSFGGAITAPNPADMSIVKAGTGTQILTGTSTYSGDTVIKQGDLRFDLGGTVNSSTIRLGDTIANSPAATLSLGFGSGNNVGSALEVRASTSGTQGQRVIRSLNPSGTNTYSGVVTMNAALSLESATGGTLLMQGGSINVTNRVLTIDSQLDSNGSDNVNQRGTVVINEVLGSLLGTGGSLIKDGSSTLILQGTSNNYTGTNAATLNPNGTRIAGGILGIYGDGSLGLAPTVAANNIFFTASSASNPTATRTLQDTANDVTLSSTRNINVASGVTAQFDSNGNTFTINGVINGSGGAIEKIGAGKLVLNGNNTYTGTTTVSAGTLLVNGNQSAATGIVTVNSGGTLGGTGTIGGAVMVSSGGNLAPGASPGILRTGSLTLASNSNFVLELNGSIAGTGYDQLRVAGTVSLTGIAGVGGGNLVLSSVSNLSMGQTLFVLLNDGTDLITTTFSGLAQGSTVSSGGFSFTIDYLANGDAGTLGNDISLTVTAVPEPSTWIGGSLALAALAYSQRRRLKRSRK